MTVRFELDPLHIRQAMPSTLPKNKSDFMAKQQQMQAPSGMAGLVRYFEEDESILKLQPNQVLAICGGLVALEIAMFFLVPL